MAEALGVASSIIAVVGASIKTTETILGLISLYRDAPVEVSFLKNDVADTQIILSNVKENISSIRHVEHRLGLTDSDAVWCNLQNNDKAGFLLKRLELSLIEIEETLRMIESKFKDNTIIDRATWMMHRNKIKTLRANLREQKDNIILYFSGSASTQASRNFVLLTKVLCENSQNIHQEGQRHNHLDALLQNMSRSLAALSTIPERQTQLIALLENLAPSVVTLEQRTTDTTSSQTIKNKSNMGKPDETPTAGAARSLPQLSPVPNTSSIQISTEAIEKCDVGGIHKMLEGRLVHPSASFKGGWTPLHYAISYGYTNIIKSLLAVGADPLIEDGRNQLSPLEWAWTKILGGVYDQETQVEMEQLFNDRDCLEEMRFPPLHRLVLGLDKSSLEEHLVNSRGQVDSVDGSGRTALSWAAQRGMTYAVTTLLRYGANPNINTPNGHSPLMFASEARNPDSIRPLLGAGANVAQYDVEGQTALHYAAGHWDDLAYYEPLVEYGSDVNWPTIPRLTPLTTVIIEGHNKAMKYLVANGADVNMKGHDGRSPGFYAVEYNNHAAIQFLQDSGVDFRGYSEAYPSVLHVAAYHADVETIKMLTSYYLVLEDVECIDSKGLTVLQIVEERVKRRNVEAGFTQAFELLLQSVVSEEVKGLESRPESEIFYDAVEYL
ncbi:hypothetical protein FOXYS1_13382 [Fusarium oxysporum]|uniref:Fungal N-terminal domain-containing protein n=1 Tax=Fusarium oxysporum TaxID=5507 RepID=A0A8H5ED16_FUSOX|nr:hypothetical protein FOXYS1_13382 [Fusarium oxysporum]